MTNTDKTTQGESNPWRAAYYKLLHDLNRVLENHVISVREIYGDNNPERAVRKETLQSIYDLASNKGRDLSAAMPRVVTRDAASNIIDGIAESIATASDADIEEEIRAGGEDPAQVAAETRAVMLGALDRFVHEYDARTTDRAQVTWLDGRAEVGAVTLHCDRDFSRPIPNRVVVNGCSLPLGRRLYVKVEHDDRETAMRLAVLVAQRSPQEGVSDGQG